jgi:hypothetical protein
MSSTGYKSLLTADMVNLILLLNSTRNGLSFDTKHIMIAYSIKKLPVFIIFGYGGNQLAYWGFFEHLQKHSWNVHQRNRRPPSEFVSEIRKIPNWKRCTEDKTRILRHCWQDTENNTNLSHSHVSLFRIPIVSVRMLCVYNIYMSQAFTQI